MLDDLLDGKTWLALDGATVATTITIDPADNGIWSADKRTEPALYVRRMIVNRRYAGLEVGARLLDWVSDVAVREHRSQWIRIDVWTTNGRLHAYYRRLGSRFRYPADDPAYPSRALFERSTDRRRQDYHAVLWPVAPLAHPRCY